MQTLPAHSRVATMSQGPEPFVERRRRAWRKSGERHEQPQCATRRRTRDLPKGCTDRVRVADSVEYSDLVNEAARISRGPYRRRGL